MTESIVPSCGCVFCDMGWAARFSRGKWYHAPNDELGFENECTSIRKYVGKDDEPSPQDLLKVRVESKVPKCGNCRYWARGAYSDTGPAAGAGTCSHSSHIRYIGPTRAEYVVHTLDLAVCSLWEVKTAAS